MVNNSPWVLTGVYTPWDPTGEVKSEKRIKTVINTPAQVQVLSLKIRTGVRLKWGLLL